MLLKQTQKNYVTASSCKAISLDWITQLRFYVLRDTKWVILEWASMNNSYFTTSLNKAFNYHRGNAQRSMLIYAGTRKIESLGYRTTLFVW